jgi:dipeptidyl aminopeptidase/acylaminoacyl peptidase
MTTAVRPTQLVLTLISLVVTMSCASPSSSPQKPVAPYGTWSSPLTAARVAAGAIRLDQIQLDGEDVYWIEGRASEGGRNVIVRRTPDGVTSDVTPPAFNVRTRVHEYGGAAYAIDRGVVYFANFADQRLYRQPLGAPPVAITTEGYYFADCHVDATGGRLLCVREDHTKDGEPTAAIVSVGLQGAPPSRPAAASARQAGRVLVTGADFYSDPIISPAGKSLAWLQWNHPNMPWDGTELWTAALEADGTLGPKEKVAGSVDESIFQPEWSPDGVLHFVSDRTGWWNLYRRQAPTSRERFVEAGPVIEPLRPMSAEFGKPQWAFSMVTYAFASPTRIVATYSEAGRWKMALIESEERRFEPVALNLEPLQSIRANARTVYFVGASPTEPPAIVKMTIGAMETEVLRSSSSERIAPEWISVPEAVTFRVTPEFQGPGPSASAPPSSPGELRRDGPLPEPRDVHAFYYPPKNPNVVAPPDEKPPLIVLTHGGPTAAAEDALDLRVQFWTSRGFAILDVNYSGSTGYGREYRDRLKGQWGIADVEDAVGAAQAMVAQGKADANRLIIRGGSAGGYTTLAALTFHRTFKAGASYYGISDIEVLARDTHKFESRYLDSLIGPYPSAKDRYLKRSPIHFTDRLSCPLILFQGLDDKVVPPNQSAMMAEAVRKKGLPVAYVTFEGEQHGFRKAENIARALEGELYFYGEVFRFTIADTVEPVKIDNPYR